jgi:hypothetical protein
MDGHNRSPVQIVAAQFETILQAFNQIARVINEILRSAKAQHARKLDATAATFKHRGPYECRVSSSRAASRSI